MSLLSSWGTTAVTFGRLVECLQSGAPINPKSVVLTFDDGFHNFYTEAYPVLQEHKFSATVFVVSGNIGGYNDWTGNPPDFPRSRLLSSNELRELHSYGIEIGSHSVSHAHLTRLRSDDLDREIQNSKGSIEDRIDAEIKSFAYPFGKFNDQVKQCVGEIYKGACTTNLGKVGSKSDLLALQRIDSYYLSNLNMFERLMSKGMNKYLALRQAMRLVRSVVSSA